MKIYAWNIGMAATIPSNNGYKLCNWIIHEILSDEPDCFILTEFVVAEGIEYFWKKLKEKNYHWFINSATKGNGIMIAIKADSFGFDTTFDYSELTVKTACDALKGNDLPDFYEIQVAWENQPLSIIGVRIKVDKNSQKNISTKQVRIISKNMYFTDQNGLGNEFAPMAYKSHDENDYYGSYCAVKHNRINALYKANVNVLIRALAALFILNIYYSFEKMEIDEISEFDFSLGSDVFMVKFCKNNYSSNDILIVDEDAEYLKKISAFADAIPGLESGEFLKFKDETPEPKRYTVKINKQY